jgi:beta-N-acetylhexosaminidase
MRGISGTRGVEEAAVLALAAGADALCVGHDLHEDAVERIHAAIVGAVRSGRLPEERVAEAAERVAALCRWTSPTATGAPDRRIGAEAARRALTTNGEVAVGGPVLVLELVPEANIAAGEALHGLADLLTDAVSVRLDAAPPDFAALLGKHADRRLVLVVRDAARYAWQEATIAAARMLRPDAIVVETGLSGARASILTHGGGRANLAAAAEALSG